MCTGFEAQERRKTPLTPHFVASLEEAIEALHKIQQERRERDMEKDVLVPQSDVQEVVRRAPTVYGGGNGGGGGGYGGGTVDRRDPRAPPPRHEATLDVRHHPRRSPSRPPPLRLLRRFHPIAYDVRRVPPA